MSDMASKWTIVDGSDSGHCCFKESILDENGNNVCELWSEHAHLIAAAPEMYALLERAKEVMLYTYDVTDYPADGNTDCDICAREIDSLLAKARGV